METKTVILKKKGNNVDIDFSEAARCVLSGGVAAFPTETVYGIAVSPWDEKAIRRVFSLKERDGGKPLTLHISDISEVYRHSSLSGKAQDDPQCVIFRKLASRFLPGPLTVILEKAAHVPDCLTGGRDTVAFRYPAHRAALALIEACGKSVAGTSANLSGGLSCTTAKAVLEELGGKIDCLVEEDAGILGVESTVISLVDGVKILRAGAIGAKMIEAVLEIPVSLPLSPQASAERTSSESISRGAREKIRFYDPDRVTDIVSDLMTSSEIAAVLFKDSMYYNIAPILERNDVRKRVRLITREGFITKFYKVLRELDGEGIREIRVPRLEGEGIETAITSLLSR